MTVRPANPEDCPEISRLMGHSGSLWQKESFDHVIRSPESLQHYRQYIRDNPQ